MPFHAGHNEICSKTPKVNSGNWVMGPEGASASPERLNQRAAGIQLPTLESIVRESEGATTLRHCQRHPMQRWPQRLPATSIHWSACHSSTCSAAFMDTAVKLLHVFYPLPRRGH